nr:hypothetical protein [Myxococcota bacterium]
DLGIPQNREFSFEDPPLAETLVEWAQAPAVVPWPAVRNVLLLDAERIAEAWAVALELAMRDRLHRGFEILADRFAITYVRAVFRALAGETQPSPATRRDRRAEWRDALQPYSEEVVGKGTRDLAIIEFLESIPILAAPEFGLTRETRELILDLVLDPDDAPAQWRGRSLDQRIRGLSDARIRHLTSRCAKDTTGETLVLRFNSAVRDDDPWVSRVSRRLSDLS